MKTNSKIDLAKQMASDGVSDDVREIRSYLTELQKDVLSQAKGDSLMMLNTRVRERFDSVVKTLKYTLPTADGDSSARWGTHLANEVAQQRREEQRRLYPGLFESKETFEKITGHTLRPISKKEKEEITATRRGKKSKVAPIKKR